MCKSLCRTKKKEYKVQCYPVGEQCVVKKKDWRKSNRTSLY